MKVIKSLSIASFRGIDSETQYLADLKKINLFIGQNNTGKSTVLNLISRYLPISVSGGKAMPKIALDELDRHRGAAAGTPVIGFGRDLSEVREEMRASRKAVRNPSELDAWLDRALSHLVGSFDKLWWTYDLQRPQPPQLQRLENEQILQKSGMQGEWRALMEAHTQFSGGGALEWVKRFMDEVSLKSSIPSARQT